MSGSVRQGNKYLDKKQISLCASQTRIFKQNKTIDHVQVAASHAIFVGFK